MNTKTAQTIVEKLGAISISFCLGACLFSALSGQWLLAGGFIAGAALSFTGAVTLCVLLDLWRSEHPGHQNY